MGVGVTEGQNVSETKPRVQKLEKRQGRRGECWQQKLIFFLNTFPNVVSELETNSLIRIKCLIHMNKS